MSAEEQRAMESRDRARRSQRIVNAYHRIFGSPDGQIVLSDIMAVFATEMSMFLTTGTRPGDAISYDTHYAAKRDGQADVVRHINAKLRAPVTGDANIEQGLEILTGLSQ